MKLKIVLHTSFEEKIFSFKVEAKNLFLNNIISHTYNAEPIFFLIKNKLFFAIYFFVLSAPLVEENKYIKTKK